MLNDQELVGAKELRAHGSTVRKSKIGTNPFGCERVRESKTKCRCFAAYSGLDLGAAHENAGLAFRENVSGSGSFGEL